MISSKEKSNLTGYSVLPVVCVRSKKKDVLQLIIAEVGLACSKQMHVGHRKGFAGAAFAPCYSEWWGE